MALITSYCGAMRAHEHQMALITSECVPCGPQAQQRLALARLALRSTGPRLSWYSPCIKYEPSSNTMALITSGCR